MELKDKIATFRKNTYNKFYWWRRFQPRQTLHKLHRLEQRVPNGDFEVSDYHWHLIYLVLTGLIPKDLIWYLF